MRHKTLPQARRHPPKLSQRARMHLAAQVRKPVTSIPGTLVLYESPYRIQKLLGELTQIFPDGQVVLARELTKRFEEFLRGTPSELIQQLQARSIKGEFVVLIAAEERTHQ